MRLDRVEHLRERVLYCAEDVHDQDIERGLVERGGVGPRVRRDSARARHRRGEVDDVSK